MDAISLLSPRQLHQDAKAITKRRCRCILEEREALDFEAATMVRRITSGTLHRNKEPSIDAQESGQIRESFSQSLRRSKGEYTSIGIVHQM
jgi:hypothetical protein